MRDRPAATSATAMSSESHPRPAAPVPEPGVDARARAMIDAVRPIVDAGAFPVKRVVGEPMDVEADVFADGHDRLGCVLRWRRAGDRAWRESRMTESHNDLWVARFTPSELGRWEYRVQAWIDPFLTWAHDLRRRIDAGQDIAIDLEIGAAIVRDYAECAEPAVPALVKRLTEWSLRLVGEGSQRERGEAALSEDLAGLMWDAAPRRFAVESEPLPLWVDRPRAQFSAWYEMFPRSASPDPSRHGTLRDVESLLPYVAGMGFDVLYLPPIHPIGHTARKGRNNTNRADPHDVGSPWAIGSEAGGHDAVHPELGTLDDFDRLVAAASDHGLEIALDIAFQCSPDHPYVGEHPDWFRHRPDGSIQYAENPPKKYQDIYPLNFECDDWRGLWDELRRVFQFWIDRGVRTFRVDNPHTKSFRFWDWVIGSIRADHPDVIFLSEAFTRPKKMYRLAKGGFTQSYTYFAWRNGPTDLRAYVEEIASPPVCDLMRPSFWPNTPDILTEYLQEGGRPAAMARLVLAATLASSYGIYGPVYELCEFVAREGAEENLDSEKYELRHWNRDDPWSLSHFIALVNRIRRENPALQQYRDVTFHHCDNPAHVAYSKRSPDRRNVILCVVNTNHAEHHGGLVRLDLSSLGLEPGARFAAHDLLTDVTHHWYGADNMVSLDAGQSHILRIEPLERTERDFETWA